MKQPLPTVIRLRPLAVAALCCAVNLACSSDDGGGSGEAAPSPHAANAEEDTKPSTMLGSAAAVRRLAIDLTLQLPAPGDTALVTGDSAKFLPLIDAALASHGSAAAVAALHPRMWHFDSRSLPDLDRYVAAGDASLSSQLTTAVRQAIVQDGASSVRYVLEQHLPFSALFTQSQLPVDPQLTSLWQTTEGGTAFAAEPTLLGHYTDHRPAAGLLTSNSFLANFDSHGEAQPRQRTSQLLQTLLCLPEENATEHTFTALSDSELTGDLGDVALKHRECSGCHAAYEAVSKTLQGLASGTSLSAWQTYSAPAGAGGLFGGQKFTSLGSLAPLFGNDPRVHRCEMLHLLEALLQRRLANSDEPTLALAVSAFVDSGQQVLAGLKPILASDDYRYAMADGKVKGSYLRTASGVRVLGRAQWQALMSALIPNNALTFSDDLDPGHDEALSRDDYIPSGVYWHAVDRLARQAADALVSSELADTALAVNRRLLTSLPDGAAAGAGSAVVTQQMQDLWALITGSQLTSHDPAYRQLQTLWGQINPGSSADESRRAWRVVLTAVFSHPAVVIY